MLKGMLQKSFREKLQHDGTQKKHPPCISLNNFILTKTMFYASEAAEGFIEDDITILT